MNITLHASTTLEGLEARLVLVDHEDDEELIETAREAFRIAISTVWAVPARYVHVATEEERERYFTSDPCG